jgi:DMSO/TMAO reductase YedYZ molybdopterin-dependent catalytic subunit
MSDSHDELAEVEPPPDGSSQDGSSQDAPQESGVERERRLRALTDDGETVPLDEHRRRSRRAFLAFGAIGVGAYLGFRHLQNRPEDGNIPDVIRRGLELNESVWETLERDGATSRSFSVDAREDIRVNGRIGLREDLNERSWSVRVIGVGGRDLGELDLTDVQELGARDMVWEHKCIEGWSNIVHWTGARFSDFADRYAGDQPRWEYVSLRTPDDEYYVALDRHTMLHGQTLLAWALNGEPLTEEHGAPLRLATPLKYGIKQLKRIGTIEFTTERPDDYWVERGYDFHAGF